ncbi:aldehyde dehydrogenase family protein, partial [Mesorhizobium sp. M00.F.Ca.ET.158.01.1.1]
AADMPLAVDHFRYFAGALRSQEGSLSQIDDDTVAYHFHEPLGVVGQIIPWNFPLLMACWKLAPALAAVNCVVLKPAEQTPAAILLWADLIGDLLPAGVLNIVNGFGLEAGKPLASSPRIAKIAFTGETTTGRLIMQYASQNLIPVTLELGGKSPNIVFADAPDLKQAAVVSANGIFRNSGQVCVAGSRLLVQASVYDRFMDELLSATTRLKVGDPLDLASDVGAVSSAEQLDKNLGFVSMATEEGARLVTGGERILAETGGSYMAPTIFENVTQDMQLAREEVFGPVLGVMRFETEEEAVRLANSTVYGLASAVW